jgi:hypothetical protein
MSRRAEPRRRFFRSFLAEAAGFVDEIRGNPQFRLEDLALLPAEVLAAMRPVMLPGFRLEEGRLVGPAAEGGVTVCPLDETERWIVARFDGRRTIAEIGDGAALKFEVDPAAAQQNVRAVFLTLARSVICVPSGKPEENQS